MADIQISCITKRGGHHNPHERIEGVGGLNNGAGKPWWEKEDSVINYINRGEHTFYVMVGGRRADVVVAEHNNRKYLKTRPDGYESNNLLSLPECRR